MFTETPVTKDTWTAAEVSAELKKLEGMPAPERLALATRLKIDDARKIRKGLFSSLSPKNQATILFKAVFRKLPWCQACSNCVNSFKKSPQRYHDRDKVKAKLVVKAKANVIEAASVPLLLHIWDSFHNEAGKFVKGEADRYQLFAELLCNVEKSAAFITTAVENRQTTLALKEPPTPTQKKKPATPVAKLAALDAASTPATPAVDIATKAGVALAGTLYGGKFPRYVEKIESGQYTDRSAALAAVAGSQALTPAGRVRLNELIDHKYPPTTNTAPTVPPPPHAEPDSSVQALYTRLEREIAAAPNTAQYILEILLQAHAAQVDLPSLAKKYGAVIHSMQRAQA